MKIFPSVPALLNAVGQHFGPTGAIAVDQERIDRFADATGDHQWIHVDAARSRVGPFGATIAHGYLTLSLVSIFLPELLQVEKAVMSINVGLNRVRFLAPVPVDSQLIATATLSSAREKGGGVQIVLAVAITIKGEETPACLADAVIRFYPEVPR